MLIAVNRSGPFEEGDDPVVEYKSAHIDGIESEPAACARFAQLERIPETET